MSDTAPALPRALYTASTVRAIDRLVIDQQGVPGIVLMERAAARAFQVLRQRWAGARRLTVLCGGGNNGGDGLVLARLARQAGLVVEVVLVARAEALAGDAALALARLVESGVQPVEAHADATAAALAPRCDVLVDALFGTGLTRPVSGLHGRALQAAAGCAAPVLALDIPSGLHADTGAVLGTCLPGDVTVTFIGLKQGLFTGAGPRVCGEVVFDDLQVEVGDGEARAAGLQPAAWRADAGLLSSLLPLRPRDAHKGHFGHVLVVGGESGLAGAGRLCAEAAARSGAGLVSLATRAAHSAQCVLACPEVMAQGVESAVALQAMARRATVLALGPGLGQEAWGREMFTTAVDMDLPKVVDADGLNWLARSGGRRDDWILTPHPAEAGRLLGVPTAEVQADRFAAASAIAARYGGVCVLKGAGSVVSSGEAVHVVGSGNPGMASGGSGDVLTGVIAAMLAQGLTPHLAALAGAVAHGHAGDLAARAGERGLLARDLIDNLRTALNPPAPEGRP